jgi:hypothetical protein
MIERDAALAVLGASIALAGLLLVFIGFILPRTETYSQQTADKFRWLARAGLIPFMASLFCAWASIWAAQGGHWSGTHLWGVLKLLLVLTAIYAIIATLVSTS